MKLIFLVDPMETLFGPIKPPYLIAKEFNKQTKIIFISPKVDKKVAELLKAYKFQVLSSEKHFFFSGSMLTMEAWLRKSDIKIEHEDRFIINCSQCYLSNANIYYAQGPVTKTLDDMYPELNITYKLLYSLSRWLFVRHDKDFNKKLRQKSRLFIANSKFCASMYEQWGIQVDDIIYPPLDCEQFIPTTFNPSEDYALTYLGKESKYSVIKKIADRGVKIKAFGSKESHVPSFMKNHSNIEIIGRLSDSELANLYSNSLFTIFTFTNEPFGYIPVESMACGTPVITYNHQGPGESILNNRTGWLVRSDEELVEMTTKLWNKGFSKDVRRDCRKRALDFDAKFIAKKWIKLIDLSN